MDIMRKVVAVTILLWIIIPGMAEAQSNGLKAKCLDLGGNLTAADTKALPPIEQMIGKKRDLEMLSQLSDLVERNPALMNDGRRSIIKIVGSVTEKSKLAFIEKNFQKNKKKVLRLVRKYTPEDGFEQYSYEMVLMYDLLMIITTAEADLIQKITKKSMESIDTSKGFEAITKMMELFKEGSKAIKKMQELRSSITSGTLIFLQTIGVDECARLNMWQMIDKHLGGGPYWKQNGLESIDGVNEAFALALNRESNMEIKTLAGQVVAKAENLQKKDKATVEKKALE